MIVSILIPVYNKIEFTKNCLGNLFETIEKESYNSLDVNYQIVVINDGSTDGTSDWIIQNYPQIHIVYGDGNLWWSGSVTIGAKYALSKLKTDFVLLWNNDIEVTPTYFKNLNQILVDYPQRTILGSAIISKQEKRIISCGMSFNKWTGNRISFNKQKSESDIKSQHIIVDMLGGMGTLIPKNVFDEIGFWDFKKFPQYSGDTDFTLRAKEKKWNVIVNTNLKLWNDTTNTGLVHNNSFNGLIESLTNIRSYYNVKTTLRFLFTHGVPFLSLFYFVKKYFFYFAGFILHKNRKCD